MKTSVNTTLSKVNLFKNETFLLQLVGGYLVYVSQLRSALTPVNMTITERGQLSDNNWHNLTLVSHHRGLQLLLEGEKVGEELDSAGVHDFLDPYLSDLFLGGARRDVFPTQDFVPISK